MNNTIKRMTSSQHRAVSMLREAGVPHMTRDKHDLALAFDVIFSREWESAPAQEEAQQVAREWVGKGERDE